MSTVRVVLWVMAGCALAAFVFLAATIRVVDPPTANGQPAPVPRSAPTDQALAGPAASVSGPLGIPVVGIAPSALRSNWGDPRGEGMRAHQGLDIMAPANTPVIAAADGRVEKLFYSNGGGGVTLYQRSIDGKWIYYYAHLAAYAPGIAEGRDLRRGETLGYVGDTGNAGAGNYHLHFGVARMAPGERWHQGTPVDPYPLLAGSRAGG
ncbi:M23 family metallopeptidase [Sphingomonas sp. ST-64]|uniref:M23 family metallopeptidase n=1 Tax=Sphingomonas plantiphila TaxID=3163295 RepID=A0ABW8YQT4_9SPHN